MKADEITIVQMKKDTTIYGLTLKSSDHRQSKDISKLSTEFYFKSNQESEKTFPFYILSKDYNESTKEFQLFVAGVTPFEGSSQMTLPKGYYAVMTIKPKFKFFWGITIGQAKTFFYRKWLPCSEYTGLNMEYEYHTQRSVTNQPTIDLYFAIKEK
ncbi:hypothetical protein SAMN02746066_01255 [Anaerosporobacter mobilis DSM 15930]|jgi:predicted transcriptional regulator YdeE|uniref:Integron-associated effector binding protein domain-containing protein n=1 Tax=Anaerosporobacter mobilis DSM 15930 TaxID=1120996 RepID=A0A1M7H2Y5_9FIRM|nr:GyrI-like domain-containing protein [Anaerosporobacter mobilis]SHM22696.1 hypothetical protein SAMN02746066_01255 [Anaerosporobacter mobilis DSM 15930]